MIEQQLPRLKYVKFTKSKGHTYAYFDLGSEEGKRRYAPLPRYGTSDFYDAYAKLLDARGGADLLTFSEDGLAESAQAAKALAQKSYKQESERHVYFVKAHTGEVKIGVAFNIEKRLNSLQAAHPHPVVLLASTVGGKPVEAHYHRRFREHWIRGEWFRPHPEIMAEIRLLRSAEQNVGLQTDVQT